MRIEETKVAEEVEEKNDKIDLLNREPFVDQVKQLCDLISKSKKNSCFAINGRWGVGKTFVLDMLEEKLKAEQQEDGARNKYLLFRYDCWEYDYYQEPVIALVAALVDEIDKNVHIITQDMATKVKGVLKAVGSGLLLKLNDTIEEKIGVDVAGIINIIEEGNDVAAMQIEEAHEYDVYFSFKKVLERLRGTIATLAEEQTLIVIVDELDRCLPEYMIKVLERLHHIFEGIPNVQVILAVDKQQLEYTIKKIYGESTDVNRYLSKFIDFTINLDTGTWNDRFEEAFGDYLQRFQEIKGVTDIGEIERFRKFIFQGIDMRSSIDIINKCKLLHETIWGESKADYFVMCIELFISVLTYWEINWDYSRASNIGHMFTYKKEVLGKNGLDIFEKECKTETEQTGTRLFAQEGGVTYVRRDSLWALLYYCYRHVGGCQKDRLMYDKYKECEIERICDDFYSC